MIYDKKRFTPRLVAAALALGLGLPSPALALRQTNAGLEQSPVRRELGERLTASAVVPHASAAGLEETISPALRARLRTKLTAEQVARAVGFFTEQYTLTLYQHEALTFWFESSAPQGKDPVRLGTVVKIIAPAMRVEEDVAKIFLIAARLWAKYGLTDDARDALITHLYGWPSRITTEDAIVSMRETAEPGVFRPDDEVRPIVEEADAMWRRQALRSVEAEREAAAQRRAAGLEEQAAVLHGLVRRVWSDAPQELREDVDGRSFITLWGRDYLLVGQFLFLTEEEWTKHHRALQPSAASVIVTHLTRGALTDQLDFTYGSFTRQAILMLQAHADVLKDQIVLDAGSGDAILARVALRLGAEKVYALERSPEWVAASERLRALAGISQDTLEILRGDFAQLQQFPKLREATVVIASLKDSGFYRVDRQGHETKDGTYFFNWHALLAETLTPTWYFLLGAEGERDPEYDMVGIARDVVKKVGYAQIGEHRAPHGHRRIPTAFLLQREKTGLASVADHGPAGLEEAGRRKADFQPVLKAPKRGTADPVRPAQVESKTAPPKHEQQTPDSSPDRLDQIIPRLREAVGRLRSRGWFRSPKKFLELFRVVVIPALKTHGSPGNSGTPGANVWPDRLDLIEDFSFLMEALHGGTLRVLEGSGALQDPEQLMRVQVSPDAKPPFDVHLKITKSPPRVVMIFFRRAERAGSREYGSIRLGNDRHQRGMIRPLLHMDITDPSGRPWLSHLDLQGVWSTQDGPSKIRSEFYAAFPQRLFLRLRSLHDIAQHGNQPDGSQGAWRLSEGTEWLRPAGLEELSPAMREIKELLDTWMETHHDLTPQILPSQGGQVLTLTVAPTMAGLRHGRLARTTIGTLRLSVEERGDSTFAVVLRLSEHGGRFGIIADGAPLKRQNVKTRILQMLDLPASQMAIRAWRTQRASQPEPSASPHSTAGLEEGQKGRVGFVLTGHTAQAWQAFAEQGLEFIVVADPARAAALRAAGLEEAHLLVAERDVAWPEALARARARLRSAGAETIRVLTDGNLISRITEALRGARWPAEMIDRFLEQMRTAVYT